MVNWLCRNKRQVVDEFHRLKILRVVYPPYSPGIGRSDLWMFGYFKGKLKDRRLPGPEEILRAFQEL
jgi:hypothetical protein